MRTVTFGGAELELLAERAAFWRLGRTLLVADTHFGKDSTFRAHAIPIPAGNTGQDLERLERLMFESEARQVVILGDFFHSRESQDRETIEALTAWRGRTSGVVVTLIPGNHDRHAGRPPTCLDIDVVDGTVMLGPWTLAHYPDAIPGCHVIGGHVHPGVLLRSGRAAPVGGACFVVGEDRMILPAFGSFTGCAEVQPFADDRIFLLGPDAGIVEIPAHCFSASTRGRVRRGRNLSREESIPERREIL